MADSRIQTLNDLLDKNHDSQIYRGLDATGRVVVEKTYFPEGRSTLDLNEENLAMFGATLNKGKYNEKGEELGNPLDILSNGIRSREICPGVHELNIGLNPVALGSREKAYGFRQNIALGYGFHPSDPILSAVYILDKEAVSKQKGYGEYWLKVEGEEDLKAGWGEYRGDHELTVSPKNIKGIITDIRFFDQIVETTKRYGLKSPVYGIRFEPEENKGVHQSFLAKLPHPIKNTITGLALSFAMKAKVN